MRWCTMLVHPIYTHLKAMKLDGMAEGFVELEEQERSRNLSHV